MRRTVGFAAVAIFVGVVAGGSACIYGVSGPEPPPGSYSAATFEVATPDKTTSVKGASISPDFLSATKLHPLLGRSFVTEDYQGSRTPVVMLGYGLWQRAFAGAPEIIGRPISIDGHQTTVVGIMPKDFSFPDGAELWVPR